MAEGLAFQHANDMDLVIHLPTKENPTLVVIEPCRSQPSTLQASSMCMTYHCDILRCNFESRPLIGIVRGDGFRYIDG